MFMRCHTARNALKLPGSPGLEEVAARRRVNDIRIEGSTKDELERIVGTHRGRQSRSEKSATW